MPGILDFASTPQLQYLIENDMYYQQFQAHTLARWISPNYVKVGNAKEEVPSSGMKPPAFTGAPIEVEDAFITEGRTKMMIPVQNRLTGMPVYGNSTLIGTEEKVVWGFRVVQLNRTRHAVQEYTGIDEQAVRMWADSLIKKLGSKLTVWNSDNTAANILASIYYGVSLDLLDPVTIGGGGLSIGVNGTGYSSHPNFFVAGSGQVSYSGGLPGTTGYESSCAAAINGLSNTSACYMSGNLIQNLVGEAARLKIQKVITKDGFEFYPLWMSQSQWRQLQSDPDFQSASKSVFISDLSKTPIGTGMVAYYGGCAIFTDLNILCAYTHTQDSNIPVNTVQYGPRPSAAGYSQGLKFGQRIPLNDTGNLPGAILVGQSMLSMGIGKKPMLVDQEMDYGNFKGLGLDQIITTVRNEQYDTLGIIPGESRNGGTVGNGAFYENTSSLLVFTYSPFAFNYS